MGHLLSRIERRPPCPPATSINSSPKSALLVEDDESLKGLFKEWLGKLGYTVRFASNSEEGLRLFRDFAPFNVVVVNYYVPQRDGCAVDCLAPQIHGVQLAKAIRDVDPFQGIIIVALDFQSAEEVRRPPEVMDIPLLIGPVNGQFSSLLNKIEVDRAIGALTSSDLLRLQKFATFRLRGLGRAAQGRDWEDLFNEAVARTLLGTENTNNGRHWNRKFNFVQHLASVMSSIANLWKRQFKEKDTYLASELLICDPEGHEHSPLDNVADKCSPADQVLMDRDDEREVLAMFADDPTAAQLFQAWGNGLKKIEIMSRLGLDEKKYAAARRRIMMAWLKRKERGRDNGR
jgi:CheY-like chemotaxis protein